MDGSHDYLKDHENTLDMICSITPQRETLAETPEVGYTIVEEVKEESKQCDQPVSFAPLSQPLDQTPRQRPPQPRAKASPKKRKPGRPVENLPFDQDEYLKPKHGRWLFRKLVKIFKNPRSQTWARMQGVMSHDELHEVRQYFSDSKCRYSYSKDGGRREIDERASSQISLLCYKINKQIQHAFLQNSLLVKAFLAARPEIIEMCATTASA